MADLTEFPLISIVVVNYNGLNFVDSCLSSVFAADYPNFEVIFVDNASTDGSLKLVKEKFFSYAMLKIIENKKSLGPVKGRNIGIANSNGKYVVFLDNDTEVDKSWLNHPILVLEKDDSVGACQSKLLLSDKKTIDTCGHYLSIIGFPYEVGSGEIDNGQYEKIRDIFGARSAAMFIRKEVLEKTGYFDEDYFMHGEETDLSWRIWIAGFRVVFVPDSVVYHKRGGSFNSESRYMILYEGSKNCTKTLMKNLGAKRLFLILPVHIFVWLSICFTHLLRGRFHLAKAVIKGLLWNICNIKRTLNKRKEIQVRSALSDRQIMPIIMGGASFSSLFKKGVNWIKRI